MHLIRNIFYLTAIVKELNVSKINSGMEWIIYSQGVAVVVVVVVGTTQGELLHCEDL